ncbi:MAG: hypothetical protein AABX33_01940 [Nanoarchaeota archaeon]
MPVKYKVEVQIPDGRLFGLTNSILDELNCDYCRSPPSEKCPRSPRKVPVSSSDCPYTDNVVVPPNIRPNPRDGWKGALFTYRFKQSDQNGEYVINTTLIEQNSERGLAWHKVRLKKLSDSGEPKNMGKVGYIILVRDLSEATPIIMQSLTRSKASFPNRFFEATNRLATIDTSDSIKIVKINEEVIIRHDISGLIINFRYDGILKEFYKHNSDIYDFLVIYAAFPTISQAYYQQVINNVEGIGLEIFDYSRFYGNNGKLKGYLFMQNLNYLNEPSPRDKDGVTRDWDLDDSGPDLHEIAHQWCCYVGKDFRRGADNAILEIRKGGIHFYDGLQSPWIPVVNYGKMWESNGDGTYRIVEEDEAPIRRYHPFILYFMGLLPESGYNTRYNIYDAGLDGLNRDRATYYTSVSVNDIIAVAGIRRVVNSETVSTPQTLR